MKDKFGFRILRVIIFLSVMLFIFTPGAYAAEEKFVQAWVKIDVSRTNTTITSSNVLEPKKVIIAIPLISGNNSAIVNSQNYSFITRTMLECTASELANITKALVTTCKEVQDYTKTCGTIFAANTELSNRVTELSTKMDGQQNLQQQVNDCNTQLTNERNNNSGKNFNNNILWLAAGGIAVYVFMYFSKTRGHREDTGEIRD